MPATISGKVYNDLNNNGTYDTGEPGISGVYVVLYNQSTFTCTSTTTNTSGNYSFSIATAGTYTIYETVSSPGVICPPTTCTQPTGFTSSNGPRKITLTVTTTQVSSNTNIINNDFSHSTNTNTLPCSNTFIQFKGDPTQWINVNLVTGIYSIKSNLNPSMYVNAIGFNPLDNYIYGVNNAAQKIVRIDSNANVTILSPYPTGLGTNLNCAAFDENGFMYLYSGSTVTPSPRFYTLDLRPTSLTYLKLVNPANGYLEQTSNYGSLLSTTLSQVIDWGYSLKTKLLYGVNYNGIVQSVNPTTGQVSNLTTTGVAPGTQGFGAAITDNNGTLYALSNATGKIYQIVISGNTATGQYFSQSLASNANDGAFCINALLAVDFGDAPDTSSSTGTNNYNTLLSNNGPRHLIVENLYIGTTVTAESDAYQNPTATGDDQSKGIQDDGVKTPVTIYKGVTSYSLPVTVTNNIGASANLYGWIDYNKDGIFQGNEAAGLVVVPSSVSSQVVMLNFNVPSTITTGYTFSRIRLTTQNLVNTNALTLQDSRSVGPAQDGEVEDYYVTITLPTVELNNLAKGNNKTQAVVGETIQYTITIPNTGVTSATNVNIYDSLTPGLQVIGTPTVSGASGGSGGNLAVYPGYNIGTIIAGNTAVLKFNVLVNSIPTPSTFINIATLTYTGIFGANTISVIGPSGGTPITKPANITTSTKGNNKVQALVGEIITYTITIPNTGSVPATDVSVYDKLTTGLQLVGIPTISGASGGTGGDIKTLPGYNIGTILAGETGVLMFDLLVVSLPNPTTYINTATISYKDPLGISTLSVSGPTNGTPILSLANLNTMTKGSNKSQVAIGDTMSYVITIPNTGSIPATNVNIYDALTEGLQLSGTPTVSGASGGTGGNITSQPGYNIGTILPGDTAVLKFDVYVATMPNPSKYINIATVSYNNGLVMSSSQVSGPTGGTQILNLANIMTSKKGSDKTQALVGQTIHYTITIPNTGETDVIGASVYDKLVTGLQIVGTPTVSGTSGGTGGNITVSPGYNIGTILAGNTGILTFDVLVVSVPNPSTYLNIATIIYQDQLGTKVVPVSGPLGGNQILKPADLDSVTKGNNKEQVVVGETIQYVITIPNTGSVPATNIRVYDKLAQGLQVIGTPTISGASGGIGGDITVSPGYNIGTILEGNTAILKFDVLVATMPNPSKYINIATISYDNQLETIIMSVSGPSGGTQILYPANISNLIKGNNKSQAAIGDTITYVVTIPNTGDVAAKNVNIYDALTPGLQVVGAPTVSGASGGSGGNLVVPPGYNIGTISAGGVGTLIFNVFIETMPNPSTYINIATVSYEDELGSKAVSVSGPSGGTQILSLANLSSSTKTGNQTVAVIGQTINYTITIPNTGEMAATNINIHDALTPGIQIVGTPTVSGASGGTGGNIVVSPGYNIGTILAGSTAVVKLNVLVVSVPNPSNYTNIATLSYQGSIGTTTLVLSGPTGGTQIQTPASISNLIKGANKTQALVGETIQYVITIPNTGQASATNVNVYDKLTPGLQIVGTPTITGASGGIGGNLATLPGYNIGTITGGVTAVLTFDVLVASVPSPSTYINTATVSYQDQLGTTTLPVSGPLGGTRISMPSNLSSASKGSAKLQAAVGDIIPYTITIPNSGGVPASNVNVYDALTPGLQIVGTPVVSGASGGSGGNLSMLPGYNVGTVEAGTTAILSFNALIATMPNPSTYINIATISYEDQLGTRTLTVNGPLGGTEVLSLANLRTSTKGCDKELALLGQTIHYIITIPNTGTISATNVNVYDSFAPGLQMVGAPTVSGAIGGSGGNIAVSPGYNVGTINGGSTAILKFDVLAVSIPTPSIYINTATISYDGPLGMTTLPVSGPTGGTQILNPANISSSVKSCSKANAVIGESILYVVTIPNTGDVSATNVNIYDSLTTGLQVSGIPSVVGAIGGTGGDISTYPGYNIGTILPGSIAILSFDALVVSMPNPSKYMNIATISYQDQLGSSALEVSGPTGGTQILTPANLNTSTKQADKSVAVVGEIVAYTVTIPNTGQVAATDVYVYDILTSGITVVGAQTITGATGGLGGSITIPPGYSVGTIQPGNTAVFKFNVLITSIPNPSTYINTATISYQNRLGTQRVLISEATGGTQIFNPANLTTSVKSCDKRVAIVGSTLQYTVTIPNTGGVAAKNVNLYDPLIPGFQIIGTPTLTGTSIGGVGGTISSPPGYNIGTIPAGGIAVLVFDVLAATLPSSSIYINTATITYQDQLGTSVLTITGPANGTLMSNSNCFYVSNHIRNY